MHKRNCKSDATNVHLVPFFCVVVVVFVVVLLLHRARVIDEKNVVLFTSLPKNKLACGGFQTENN